MAGFSRSKNGFGVKPVMTTRMTLRERPYRSIPERLPR
jgi:hypothetical protein